MTAERYLNEKQAFIFELDDVLFPQKDYVLQAYYLFAQFIEYGEQLSAPEILKYMQDYYAKNGGAQIFEATAAALKIPEKYKMNFELLLLGAKLPLKLLLYDEVLKFLQGIVLERKQIFLFTDGDPAMQLNKIKQIEWNGLEQYLRVYFSAETAAKPATDGLDLMISEHGLDKKDVLFVGRTGLDEEFALNGKIDFLNVNKLLLS